ncbi:tetratricopeptide repeat protein [Vibrio ostreicida]|uniref:MSHA biogenesis protein MshN n=1 Tax=Vibrio ostreicida TaxID=526588 RepID=A0ABT8BML8_9VIBR|nr:MSHA biogenesis protein MshN [Vibrio ostreicida]MDN3608295.1 MSHA biogenesis protein MshN [Vibrio ostreicida]NPD09721.1 MSHA biogenesis protein MshN [Vibrio ostreicida]
MSTINTALSELADKAGHQQGQVERANISPIEPVRILPWIVGSVTLSLALGGWAVSSQAPVGEVRPVEVEAFPLHKQASPEEYTTSLDTTTEAQLAEREWSMREQPNPLPASVPKSTPLDRSAAPLLQPVPADVSVSRGEIVVEHVELTPQQLADKAQIRGQKALDSNNLKHALDHYHQALRYTPDSTPVRQTLSALYYGKGEVRKAVDMLSKGVQRNKENVELRLSLARLLVKEQQKEAALTALVFEPKKASVDYFSLRAILAQQTRQDALALDSYQSLVALEPESGRWWLGLGIQQERALNLPKAEKAYQQALLKLGLSSQSQQFIRDRLALIRRLEEPLIAN